MISRYYLADGDKQNIPTPSEQDVELNSYPPPRNSAPPPPHPPPRKEKK